MGNVIYQLEKNKNQKALEIEEFKEDIENSILAVVIEGTQGGIP